MRIGVLALQGAFYEHEQALSKLGAQTFQIRTLPDLNPPLDGILLPGGESTVMGKLLHKNGLFAPIQTMIQNGLPVYGTCAGLILLSKKIGDGAERWFSTMDLHSLRNAYGRQLASFADEGVFDGRTIPMVFIRAPKIQQVFGNAMPLGECRGLVVAARQENQLVTAFHPELTECDAVHRYFLNMVEAARSKRGV